MAAKKQKRAKAKRPSGRPPEAVPPDIADAIIEWLYEGKALLAFCRQPGMPKRQTIDDWKEKDSAFASRFARARRAQGQLLLEIAQEVADDGSQDYVAVATKDGGTKMAFDSEHVQRSKLRVDQLNRRAACYDPAHCGTKVAIGGDADAPPIKLEQKGPPVPPLGDYVDPATGKTRPGLLTGIMKLHGLAQELLTGSKEPADGQGG